MASEPESPSPKIVGGQPASETYTFMASLQDGGQHVCGASLIKPNWAVTAAHCVGGGNLSVRVGTTTWASGGETANVTNTVTHDTYDIALLELDTELQTAPIAIAENAGDTGTATRLIGWGQTCPEPGCGPAPDELQEIDVEVRDAGECSSITDPASELCLGKDPGTGACYGDSGGPSVIKVDDQWALTGATSRAGNDQPTCGEAPAVYTNVTAFADWIAQNTGG